MFDTDRKHELGMKIVELLNDNKHTSMKDDAEILLALLYHCLTEIGVEKIVIGTKNTVAVVNIVSREIYDTVEDVKKTLEQEVKSESNDTSDAPTSSDSIH